MSLPCQWVDKIFRKLTLAYGRAFLDRWEGVAIADVKTDWGHELAGYESAPECIAYALSHLPASRPPTVFEFRELCARAPRKQQPALTWQPDPERLKQELSKLLPVRQAALSRVDHKAWAKALRARHERGERLSQYQVACYRQALKMDLIPADPMAGQEAA